LRRDFVEKLTNSVTDEIRRLNECSNKPGADDLGACLGIHGLEQAKLYALMEGQLFVYRSMYSEHLNKWLKVVANLLFVHVDLLMDASVVFIVPRRGKSEKIRCTHFAISQVYPAHQMLIIPSEKMKVPQDMKDSMARFAQFLGLPDSGPRVHHDLIFKSSPAAKGVGSDGHVHENGRTYIAESPAELSETLHKVCTDYETRKPTFRQRPWTRCTSVL